MSNQVSRNRIAALFFMRVLLGLIFLMQGYGKVFKWTINGVYESVFKAYESLLPIWLLKFTVYYTSIIELVAGLLLVIGLFRSYAYYALASVLLIVSFGHGLNSPIWSLEDVFPRAILLVGLLLLPKSWDLWAVDPLLFKESPKNAS